MRELSYNLFNLSNETIDSLNEYFKTVSTENCVIFADAKSIKCKSNLFSEALFKVYAKKTSLCVRFDNTKVDFAERYLSQYISERVNNVADKFVRCRVAYSDFEKFFETVKEAVQSDNAKRIEAERAKQSEVKQSEVKQSAKQTVSKAKQSVSKAKQSKKA